MYAGFAIFEGGVEICDAFVDCCCASIWSKFRWSCVVCLPWEHLLMCAPLLAPTACWWETDEVGSGHNTYLWRGLFYIVIITSLLHSGNISHDYRLFFKHNAKTFSNLAYNINFYRDLSEHNRKYNNSPDRRLQRCFVNNHLALASCYHCILPGFLCNGCFWCNIETLAPQTVPLVWFH